MRTFIRALSATFGILFGLLLWPAVVFGGLLVGLLVFATILGNLAR